MTVTVDRKTDAPLEEFARELILKYSRLPRKRKKRVDRLFVELNECADSEEQGEIVEAILEIISPDLLGIVDPVGTPVDQDETNAAAPENVIAYQKKIGEAIKRERVRLRMTQAELAAKAGIPQSHVSRLESGQHMPTGKTIKTIAEALEVAPSQIDLLYQDE